jgi:hypothetical protein
MKTLSEKNCYSTQIWVKQAFSEFFIEKAAAIVTQ